MEALRLDCNGKTRLFTSASTAMRMLRAILHFQPTLGQKLLRPNRFDANF